MCKNTQTFDPESSCLPTKDERRSAGPICLNIDTSSVASWDTSWKHTSVGLDLILIWSPSRWHLPQLCNAVLYNGDLGLCHTSSSRPDCLKADWWDHSNKITLLLLLLWYYTSLCSNYFLFVKCFPHLTCLPKVGTKIGENCSPPVPSSRQGPPFTDFSVTIG